MGKGGNSNANSSLVTFTWEEVKKHTKADDKWLVIDGGVYDVTRWQKKHPGGAKIIGHYAGQDATDAFQAMHPDKEYATKFMKAILIGQIEKPERPSRNDEMMADFRKLRHLAEERDLFRASPLFFGLHFLHIVLLEILAYFTLTSLGGGPVAFFLTAVVLTIGQAQAGWTQHDYGHLSVFPSTRVNHIFHHITIGILKAAGSHWWNFRHFQHHVKPNVYKKDPDITLPHVFLIGDKIAKKWGDKKRGVMPYQQQHNYFWVSSSHWWNFRHGLHHGKTNVFKKDPDVTFPLVFILGINVARKWGRQKRGYSPYQHQHQYFWLLGPLTLLPLYFHLENIYFVFKRRDYVDLIMTVIYFARFDYLYAGYYGTRWMSFALYMFMRCMESFWFTFVTQMSHLPMEVDEERNNNWVTQQTTATCNIEPSAFNDWFTGHLNFQIEHHLFPTMPRHNLHKMSEEVQALCKKYNQPYVVKGLFTAFGDILRSLRKSGNVWHEAYNAF